MSQGDEFKFQRSAATNLEREQGTEGRQKREHADDGMTAASKTLCSLGFFYFEQAQVRTARVGSEPGHRPDPLPILFGDEGHPVVPRRAAGGSLVPEAFGVCPLFGERRAEGTRRLSQGVKAKGSRIEGPRPAVFSESPGSWSVAVSSIAIRFQHASRLSGKVCFWPGEDFA